ncbi:hypothetical protein VNO77_12113 [Canavalia gladiata]|uniref:Uncharacterized protein n=1 Tax=Canavalia gladiata TaxID=3824 RepID=A0AAN9M128_CANGL
MMNKLRRYLIKTVNLGEAVEADSKSVLIPQVSVVTVDKPKNTSLSSDDPMCQLVMSLSPDCVSLRYTKTLRDSKKES